MIPGLLLILLHGCEIKSGSDLGTRLHVHVTCLREHLPNFQLISSTYSIIVLGMSWVGSWHKTKLMMSALATVYTHMQLHPDVGLPGL